MISELIATVLRAAGDGTGERIFGIVFAEIAGVADDGYRLRYTSLPLDDSSVPARLCTPMAGNERGVMFRPELGDEVAVMFECGDVNQPVIVGALHSEVDRPPAQADGDDTNNVRTIVSRSGHEVTLDDTPGATKIVIRSQGGFEITLEDSPPKIAIKTTGNVATSRLVLDGVSWNHQHATGTGPSGPPLSIVPPTP